MLPYLILYAFFVAWWIFDLTGDKNLKWIISVFVFLVALIFIGLRHEVGGDWGDYLMWYKVIEEEGANIFEPGYNMLNKLSALLGGGIYLVNIISLIIIILLFWKSSKIINLSIPIFCLLIFPHHILIVIMGYSRQAIAVSFTFYAVIELLVNRRKLYFMLLITIAILFHYSAFSAFALLFIVRKTFSIKLIILMMFITFISLLLNISKLEPLLEYYINPQSKMVSHGALVRLLIWTSILCLVIMFKSRLSLILRYGINWYGLFLGYLICVLLLSNNIMTVLVDRFLLYFYLIPYLGLSSILYNIRNNTSVYGVAMWGCVISSLLISVVWLGLAIHKRGWVPYSNIIWY